MSPSKPSLSLSLVQAALISFPAACGGEENTRGKTQRKNTKEYERRQTNPATEYGTRAEPCGHVSGLSLSRVDSLSGPAEESSGS